MVPFSSGQTGMEFFVVSFPMIRGPCIKKMSASPKAAILPSRARQREPWDPHGRLALRCLSFVGNDSVFTAAFRIPLCKYSCLHNKNRPSGRFCYVAERVGFEPTDARASPVFKTGAFNHSTISPNGRGLLYHRLRRRSILCQSTRSLPESSVTSTRQTSTWGYWAI